MTWGKWFVIAVTVQYAVEMLGYEFWALYNKVPGQPGNTISEMVWGAINGKPWLAALLCIGFISSFGLLMGHFFWQARN